LRGLKLTLTLLMISLASSAPALAQSPPAASQQYGEVSTEALEVGDIIRAAADSAARGTGSLNGALSDDKPPAAAAATPSSGDASDPPDGKVAGLAMLPATGGVSALWPLAGALLVMTGLASLVRRAAR
jgi:hypothetical protein